MQKLQLGAVALALAGVSFFGVFCLTVIHFEEGELRFKFRAPGVIELDAELNKGTRSDIKK